MKKKTKIYVSCGFLRAAGRLRRSAEKISNLKCTYLDYKKYYEGLLEALDEYKKEFNKLLK